MALIKAVQSDVATLVATTNKVKKATTSGVYDWVGNAGGKAGIHIENLSKSDVKVGDDIGVIVRAKVVKLNPDAGTVVLNLPIGKIPNTGGWTKLARDGGIFLGAEGDATATPPPATPPAATSMFTLKNVAIAAVVLGGIWFIVTKVK